MRALLFVALCTTTLSCNAFSRGACKKLAVAICDECDVENYDKALCGCIEDGEFDNDDVDDYFDGEDDDAELACWRLQEELKSTYQTPETVSYCRQEKAFLKEHGSDACVEMGYEDVAATTARAARAGPPPAGATRAEARVAIW
jgi:hypothetical protein